jgi:hypothetical protein
MQTSALDDAALAQPLVDDSACDADGATVSPFTFGGGSALSLCGRRWNCSADDVLVPASCRICVYAPVLVVLCVSYAATGMPVVPSATWCARDQRLAIFAVCTIALYALFVALDAAAICLAVRARFLQPNAGLVRLLALRICAFALHVAATVAGTVFFLAPASATASDGCAPPTEDVTRLGHLAVVITVVNWCVIGASLCSYYGAYDAEGLTDEFASASKIEALLHCITCSWCVSVEERVQKC